MDEAQITFAARRFRALLEQLGFEMGNRHGWKATLARRLEIHPSYVTKVLAGQTKEVGVEVLKRAAREFGIDGAYFFEVPTGPGVPVDYHDYLRGGKLPRRRRLDVADPEALLADFIDSLLAAQLASLHAAKDAFATETMPESQYVRVQLGAKEAEPLLAAIDAIPLVHAARGLREAIDSGADGRTIGQAYIALNQCIGVLISALLESPQGRRLFAPSPPDRTGPQSSDT